MTTYEIHQLTTDDESLVWEVIKLLDISQDVWLYDRFDTDHPAVEIAAIDDARNWHHTCVLLGKTGKLSYYVDINGKKALSSAFAIRDDNHIFKISLDRLSKLRAFL